MGFLHYLSERSWLMVSKSTEPLLSELDVVLPERNAPEASTVSERLSALYVQTLICSENDFKRALI